MERYTMRLPDDLGAVPVSGYGTPEIIDRLAAYEDTGLTPEEIIGRLAKQKVEDIFTAETKTALDKLMEYKTAEKEGRLLVLPCKVGDKVYQTDGIKVYESTVRQLIFDTENIAFDVCAIGKSVFRTREEAETKLKERGE